MGRYSGQLWSQLLQIDDECLAFDFDQCCALRLRIDDTEREKRQLEAMAGGAFSRAFSEPVKPTVEFREGSF